MVRLISRSNTPYDTAYQNHVVGGFNTTIEQNGGSWSCTRSPLATHHCRPTIKADSAVDEPHLTYAATAVNPPALPMPRDTASTTAKKR